jgi:3-hydroxyacyl-CoA dehydrogenase/3a,7a,12a-trihydroxy-5b-cholest-24-enoyl-CoA hydratase
MKLFTGGKLKITGNIMASQKLDFLRKVDPADVMAATKKRAGAGGGGGAAAAAPAAASSEPTSTDVFGGIAKYLAKTGGQGDKIKTVFQFKLKSPDAVWTIDLAGGDGKVAQGESAPPGCTLEITDADFMDMCTGKADAMKLFTGGKLKITGNIMASQKLDFLRKVDPADVAAAMKERTGGGGGAAAAPAAAAPAAAPAKAASGAGMADEVARKIANRIAENANLAKEVGAVVEVRVKDPDAVFTIDLKSGAGAVNKGKAEKADTILTVGDHDLLTLTSGGASLRSLFQHGKLRVDGDVGVVRKLAFLEKVG